MNQFDGVLFLGGHRDIEQIPNSCLDSRGSVGETVLMFLQYDPSRPVPSRPSSLGSVQKPSHHMEFLCSDLLLNGCFAI